MNQRTLLMMYYLLGILCVFISVFLLNYLVNPYVDYAHDPQWPTWQEANPRLRKIKLKMLNRLDERPEVYILGNSRSMTFPTAPLETYTGLKAFNLGVVNGSVYDFLALTRYLFASQPEKPPQVIISTLDTFSFSATLDQELYDFPLIQHMPELGVSLHETQLKRFRRTLTLGAAFRSLKLVNAAWLQRDAEPGLINTYTPENFEGLDEARYAVVIEAYRDRDYVGPDPLPAERRAIFEAWLALANEHDICLIIILPPLYTPLVEILAAESDYTAHMTTLRTYLDDLQSTYAFEWYDFSTVDRFGGDDKWFYDGSHFMPSLAEQMLAELAETSPCLKNIQ